VISPEPPLSITHLTVLREYNVVAGDVMRVCCDEWLRSEDSPQRAPASCHRPWSDTRPSQGSATIAPCRKRAEGRKPGPDPSETHDGEVSATSEPLSALLGRADGRARRGSREYLSRGGCFLPGCRLGECVTADRAVGPHGHEVRRFWPYRTRRNSRGVPHLRLIHSRPTIATRRRFGPEHPA
jgi:hypothetical protein